jgi:curved DNA-binding protein CbpA
MTFYEELGIPPGSSPELIHDAYRNLARLLHPDAHTDPALKRSAEAQMKRINRMYSVLSDPERRRRYDLDLAEPQERPGAVIIPAPSRAETFRPTGGTMVWLAATAICAAFILWLATRETSLPAVYPFPPASGSASSASGAKSAIEKAAAAILPHSAADKQRENEIAMLRTQLAAALADRDRLIKQMEEMEALHKFKAPAPIVSAVPPPLIAPSADLQIAVPGATPTAVAPPEPPEKKLAGVWQYRHSHSEGKNRTLFPPEFIEATISEENGRLRGRYHARFKVADRKIPPDVDFHFEGKISGPAGKFAWSGNGGAAGEVRLRLVSDTALEVTWSATSLSSQMGLASGTAVLNK